MPVLTSYRPRPSRLSSRDIFVSFVSRRTSALLLLGNSRSYLSQRLHQAICVLRLTDADANAVTQPDVVVIPNHYDPLPQAIAHILRGHSAHFAEHEVRLR